MLETIAIEIMLEKQKRPNEKNSDFLKELKRDIEETGIGKVVSAAGWNFEN